ncbi:hypothetical protein ACFYZT_19085 [Streptomyces sp. NPDC001591]|uniref:hypothetical protein n=1 Tax=Streptomyces sp. NPDC001591 TaxID=3364589 RepID=UPI0036CB77A7
MTTTTTTTPRTTTPPAMPSPAKTWAAAAVLALSLALAACGTQPGGARTAPPAPLPPSTTCAPPTQGLPPQQPPTEDEPPTTPQPPTEDEPPSTLQSPTEDEPPGAPQPPTEDEPPSTPQPPTEDAPPGTPQPPTDGESPSAPGRQPCPVVVDGWYDMTRDFDAYYARHRTGADTLMPPGSLKEVRVRKAGGTSEARVAFTTGSVGKGLGEDARRIAQVFADWRHEVYGDTGTVRVRTADGEERAALSW